ncbi:MAG: hypothetical protein LBB94_02460 [Clostridiales bacterium]|jgi:hypothetical protein|nr:hypothetical protein [Clostridiales bacterium]
MADITGMEGVTGTEARLSDMEGVTTGLADSAAALITGMAGICMADTVPAASDV